MQTDLVLNAAADFSGTVKTLLDEFGYFRTCIIGDLSDFDYPELRSLLEPLLGERCSFADRLAAAYTLCAWGLLSEAADEILRFAMNMPGDLEFGAAAAAALVRHGDRSAVTDLKEIWKAEGTFFIFKTAVDTLCRIGDAEVLQRAQSEMDSGDPWVVWAGALAQIGDMRAMPVLMRYLDEGDPTETIRAMQTLCCLRDPSIEPRVRAFTEDKEADLRRWAFYSLARMAEPRSAEQKTLLVQSWLVLREGF